MTQLFSGKWVLNLVPESKCKKQYLAEKNEVIPTKCVPQQYSIYFILMHNHLGMLLNDKLNYEHHLNFVLNEVNMATALLCKFPQSFLRQCLMTIYKSFIQLHLDCGEIVYDQVFNKSFHKNFELTQCNPAIAIIGAIRSASPELLFLRIRLRILKIGQLWKVH